MLARRRIDIGPMQLCGMEDILSYEKLYLYK